MTQSRRRFLKHSALAAGAPMVVPGSVLGKDGQVAPSNRIVLGGVGLGPRGRKVLTAFLKHKDVQFVAVADPQKERREIIRKMAAKYHGIEGVQSVPHMETIFEREDVDAVLIATGERWHATASILAARSGKDVYSEKPCSMTINESIELDEEIRKHKRVFQAGTQRRSVPNFQLAAKLARSGRLGKLTRLHASIYKMMEDLPPLPEQPLPAPLVVDWDRWLGPASERPYNEKYCQGRWRRHTGLSCSWMLLDWGAHTIDLCQWAAKKDGTTPVKFEASSDTHLQAVYADGLPLVMREGGFRDEGDWIKGIGTCPVRFEGEEGWVEAGDSGRLEVSDPKLLEGFAAHEELAGVDPVHHARNFLDCVKSREQPICSATVARYGHVAGHAAALSWKLARPLAFDPETATFDGDDEANRMRSYARRAPWAV